MSAIWLSLVMLATTVIFWLQPNVLSARLFLPQLPLAVDRHTPRYPYGTYLPPVIATSQTFPTAASPLILAGPTLIAADATVTLAAGTHLYANEFATLTVEGTLRSLGTSAQPVVFSTNEQHPANQLWNGLVFTAGSRGDLRYTTIEFATPAVTCLAGSQVTSLRPHLKNTRLATFTASAHCL